MDHHPENVGVHYNALEVFCPLIIHMLNRHHDSTLLSSHWIQTVCPTLKNFQNDKSTQFIGFHLLYGIQCSLGHSEQYDAVLLDFYINLIQSDILQLAVSSMEHQSDNIYAACFITNILWGEGLDSIDDHQTLREHIQSDPNVLSVLEHLRELPEETDHESRGLIAMAICFLVKIVDEQQM